MEVPVPDPPDVPDTPDHVDRILAQWARERPDLDASPMAVFGRLSRASLLASGELRKTFAEHGLDAGSFDVLATLRRHGDTPLTPSELMRSSMVTSGAVTQRLDRLESAGLLERRRGAGDGRTVHVQLTTAGRTLIDRAVADHVATEHRLLASLTVAQRAALTEGLRALLGALEAG